MRRSLIVCAAIFLVTGLVGWRKNQQLASLSQRNADLVAQVAANSGGGAISLGTIEQRREFAAMKERVKTLALDYFALFRDYGDNPTGESGDAFAKLQVEIRRRMEELDPAAIKQFMDQCCSNPEFNLRIKRDLNNYVRTVFISKYPIEMARMMSGSPELFGIDEKATSEGYIQDPFKHLVYYYSWEKKDIQLVFQCLSQSSPEFQSRYLGGTLEFYAYSAPKRTELLEEMRAFASTPEQAALVKREMSGLVFGRGDARASFVAVSDWLASANLSGDELVAATRDMQKKVRVGETGQWLDWLADSDVPDDVASERAFELATAWTENDYLAAGKWLNRAPDSPEKSAVASAYAASTYPYDPEGAMQWIQTLPEGADRTKALETIYRNMPEESETAESFAREHGLRK
jgi:hypothetical protein